MKDFYEALTEAVGEGHVIKEEPMKKHTTFRVGGPARFFVTPPDEQALKHTVLLCLERNIDYYILGNGSNLLVSDTGYDGVMISMGEGFSKVEAEGSCITAGAGALLSKIAKLAYEEGLTGFEFAAGIPGMLGGAVVMNAGAYEGEMKQILKSVVVLTKIGEIKTLCAEELELSYRHSCIPEHEYIVLSAIVCLSKGEQSEIQSRMHELAAKRKDKQPLEYPSAGSTFKRPEGYFAGKLIQDAGLRGYTVGGAQVSEKHCGFVVNKGTATAADIRTLCGEVQKKVEDIFGVRLETEVKMLGF